MIKHLQVSTLSIIFDSNLETKSKMETTKEIEIYKVELENEVVTVDYTIFEPETKTDVSYHQIAFSTLLQHCKDEEMNLQYVYSPDELTELDADIFTRENLHYVVKDYLTENLK